MEFDELTDMYGIDDETQIPQILPSSMNIQAKGQAHEIESHGKKILVPDISAILRLEDTNRALSARVMRLDASLQTAMINIRVLERTIERLAREVSNKVSYE